MINLEWLRTFRTVYKTKSLSAASELLNISQPTVSQQIRSLESYLGQELFTRKSKGVLETDEGKILNTLVSGIIEELEEVESQISHKNSKLNTIVTIGISSHLYKTALCYNILKLGKFVHVKFGTKQELISEVEQGLLLYAIIPDEINTFDTICYPIEEQELVLVSSPDLDLKNLNSMVKKTPEKAQKLLSSYKWYAHDAASGYIKQFWLNTFNKKRPNIVPNYIIPNEYEVLSLLTNGTEGLSVAIKSVAKSFIEDGTLRMYNLDSIPYRKLSLIVNKKKSPKRLTEELQAHLCKKHKSVN